MIRKLTKTTAALLLVLVAAAGTVGATAQPASAATGVSACFRWDTGSAYRNQPVYLEKWQNGKWTSFRSGRTNANGCATFTNVPSNVYVTIHAYAALGDSNIGMALYSGYPPYYANPGQGSVSLGTGTVRLVQCVWGLYGYCAGLR